MQRIRKFFEFEERGASLRTEFIGGLVTFLAMSYILVVNPGIVSGQFSPNGIYESVGIPYGGVFFATACGAALATIVMALFAKLPVALAPGMGVNAFFINVIIVGKGFTWQEALAISFIGGLIFLAISFTKIRKILINAIPEDLKSAIGVGIGFFIAVVGLRLGGIFNMDQNNGFSFGDLTSPTVLLSWFSILSIIAIHSIKGKISKFSFIISIVATALIGVILSLCGVGVTETAQGKMYELPFFSKFDYSPLADIKDVAFVGMGNGFKTLFSEASRIPTIIFLTFALLFVDIFDTAGTLVAVGKEANLVDENGEIRNIDKALFADAVGTVISSSLGTPEITSYVESATGVEAGARTGLSSLVVAFLFLLSIALFPVFKVFTYSSVTCGALVLVGILMSQQAADINWRDISSAIPAFLTIIGMVVTGSVADGIAFGFISYTLVKLIKGEIKKVHPIVWASSILFIAYFVLMAIFG